MTQRKKPTADRSRLTATGLPILAVVLTFFIRLWFILEMQGQPFSVISAQTIDAYYYHQWALQILHGNFWGSDVFFLRPLYPYLLALVYAVFGVNLYWVQVLQALLGTASCFLLYDSTRRIFNRTSALFAAFGFALTGILVFYTGALLYVEVTVFFSLLTFWLMLVAKDKAWRWALAGVSFGLMVICRPELLVLLPAFIIILWRQRHFSDEIPRPKHGLGMTGKGSGATDEIAAGAARPRNDRIKPGVLLAFALSAVAVIAVVPIRNLIVAGEPVVFTAHSGINFYYGNNPYADGTWQPTELERTAGFSHEQLKHIARFVDGRELSWSQASSYWTRKGLSFLVGNPGRALWLLSRKFLLFWSNYEVPNNYYPETVRPQSLALKLAFVSFALIAALGLVGMVLALRRPFLPLSLYPLLLVAGYLLSALVFYVLSRLRAPVIPFLLMFAGFGLAEIIRAAQQRKWPKLAATILPAAALYVGSNLIPVDRHLYTSQAWTQAGNIYLRLGSSKAFDAYRNALAADPSNPSARYSLFVALAGMGNMREAEVEYEDLLKTAGNDPRNRVLVELAGGRIAIAHHDFPEAALHYRAAVTLDPLNAENHYLLGLVYVSMDSLEQARASLSQALEIDPNHDAARSSLKMVESHLATRPQK